MALQRADEPQYSNTFVKFTPQPEMPYTSLGNISGDKFELFRNDALIVAGVMKATVFNAINVELGSDPHPVTKMAL